MAAASAIALFRLPIELARRLTCSLMLCIWLLMKPFCSLRRSCRLLKRRARPSASASTSSRAGVLAGSSAAAWSEAKNFCSDGEMPVVVPASSESSWSIWLL
ncbi:hypothetical protein FQZ97_1005860 [compost metagenome]